MVDPRPSNLALRTEVQNLASKLRGEADDVRVTADNLEGVYGPDLEAFKERLEWLLDEVRTLEHQLSDVVTMEQHWLTKLGQSETLATN